MFIPDFIMHHTVIERLFSYYLFIFGCFFHFLSFLFSFFFFFPSFRRFVVFESTKGIKAALRAESAPPMDSSFAEQGRERGLRSTWARTNIIFSCCAVK